MLYDEIQSVYQICSFLLTYPDQDFKEALIEIEDEIHDISEGKLKTELQQFVLAAKRLSSEELIHTYVYTFDFGKKTNLYVTYMTSGEQRERGIDLLYLKNYYKLHGFEATDLELPDYLPLMLEFAGQVDGETLKPIFEKYYENILEIYDHLIEQKNVYGHILEAVIGAINESGIKETKRRSEEMCSINFFG